MKKIVEFVIIFLITFSIIEFSTILLSLFLHNYASYVNVDALVDSKILILEVTTCLFASLFYYKSVRK